MLRLSSDVRRWEQTDDVFQNAMMRLYRSLEQIELQDARHFFHVAALQIRRELIDLARRYQGAHGMGRNLRLAAGQGRDGGLRRAGSSRPSRPTIRPTWPPGWSFTSAWSSCPEEDEDVFHLLWYGGLTAEEAAEALHVSARTVRRRWQSARLALHDVLSRSTIEL